MEDKSESPEYIHEVAVARRGQALSDKKRDAEITKDSRDNLKR